MPSTAIRTLSYDDETATLFVTFIDGDVYAYFEVPAQVHADFRAARSKGGFFARRVRSKYRYQKVGGDKGDDLFGATASPPSGGPASPPPAAAGR
jgi:hypothetical protein